VWDTQTERQTNAMHNIASQDSYIVTKSATLHAAKITIKYKAPNINIVHNSNNNNTIISNLLTLAAQNPKKYKVTKQLFTRRQASMLQTMHIHMQ